MMPRLGRTLALALTCATATVARSDVMTLPTGFADSLVIGGLAEPVGLTWVPGAGPPRLLVIEQRTADVRLIVGARPTGAPVVGTVPAVRSTDNERGLLGIAVDPAFPGRPYLYTWSSSTTGFMRLSRFTLAGDLAGTGSGALTFAGSTRFDLIADAPDQAGNHNGGALRFGPDGMLYVSIGDDASSCAAQDTVSLRGVILRLRVDALADGAGSATRAEITPADNPFVATGSNANARLVWALGFRNPFRFHVDSATGALFVADVGQNTWEELSRIVAGANAGWPWREGPAAYGSCGGSTPAGLVGPIASFDHGEGASVMSLGVYRTSASGGAAFPAEYQGDVFYSDYYAGFVRRLRFDGSQWTSPAAPGQPGASDWARDASAVADALVGPDGALWYVRQFGGGGGEVSRVVRSDSSSPPPPPPPPARAALGHPTPNPFADAMSVDWTLPFASRLEIAVFDVRGVHQQTLLARELPQGSGRATWDGRGPDGSPAPPGVYYVHLLQDGARVATRGFVRVQ